MSRRILLYSFAVTVKWPVKAGLASLTDCLVRTQQGETVPKHSAGARIENVPPAIADPIHLFTI